ncbi:hypothetical protein MHYP_G00140470 [Metynnis hypsauchen]
MAEGGRRSAAPDGGWGWMIVAGCFLTTICTRAVTRCVSIFFVEFHIHFSSDYSRTAWIHSLVDCTTMLCAPLGSYIGNRLSCRAAVMVGGLLSSVGLVLSSFATSLEYLYLSLGVLTGVGFAFCYTPAIAMVGTYFKVRKALAYGIAMSGTGIGTFILAPVVQLLIELYSWRGALLILGGLVSHLCVCGALMRPFVNPRLKQSSKREFEFELVTSKLHMELNLENAEAPRENLEISELGCGAVNTDKERGRGLTEDMCEETEGLLENRAQVMTESNPAEEKLIDSIQRDFTPEEKTCAEESPDSDVKENVKDVDSKPEDTKGVSVNRTSKNSGQEINIKSPNLKSPNQRIQSDASLDVSFPANSVLVNLKLAHAKQANSVLTGSELAESVLVDSELNDSKLIVPLLANADLTGSKLPESIEANSTLTASKLAESIEANSVLTGSELAELIEANSVLTDSNLAESIEANSVLTGSELAESVLVDSELNDSKLIVPLLANADLTGTKLAESMVGNSVLTGSELPEAVLVDSELNESKLTVPFLANPKLTDSNLAVLVLLDSALHDSKLADSKLLCEMAFSESPGREKEGHFFPPSTDECRFLLMPDFLLLSVSFLFLAFGCSVPFVYLVPYSLSIGVGHQQAALLMSVLGVMGIVGNITFGWISDRKCLRTYRIVSYLLAVGLEGLGCLFVPLLRNFPLLVPFALFYGYFDGAYVALLPVVTSDTVGPTYLSSALGMVCFLHAIPYLISPPIAGWLVDQTGSYTAAFLLSGFSLICSASILATVSLARRCNRKRPSQSYLG